MIHYHGVRIAVSDDQAARILAGRHACVSFADLSQHAIVQEVCQSYMLDNGAYSLWKSGAMMDWDKFYKFVSELSDPHCDFWIIPDAIDASEDENNRLIEECPLKHGVPVWHYNESIQKLEYLCQTYDRVCLGTTAGLVPGTSSYWTRLHQALDAITDAKGRLKYPAKLHGLRALQPEIFRYVPFSSADSTAVGRNISESSNSVFRSPRTFAKLSPTVRAAVLIDRIEQYNSPPYWERRPIQTELF